MADYKTFSDNELITLLRLGNRSAYTEIYNRYNYLMIVFAYKKLRDEDLARDFVQELFITLWDKRETISEDGNLAQFLYVSLRNRMFSHFAHQKVEHKYFDFLAHTFSEFSNGQTDYLVREKQLISYIEKQIEKLPSKMKVVFLLSRNEQLSNREIAERLNTTESNVSHHISNALKILRKRLNIVIYLTLFAKMMPDKVNKDMPVIKLSNHHLVRMINDQRAVDLRFDNIILPFKSSRENANEEMFN